MQKFHISDFPSYHVGMQNAKSIFASKTFWLAVLQSVAGAFVIFGTSFPDWAGQLLIAKSLIDVVLRAATDKPVSL